tara:strand:- start:76 stop:300 length:225 start_codon:yes stop_codon:yes gene_type:complete
MEQFGPQGHLRVPIDVGKSDSWYRHGGGERGDNDVFHDLSPKFLESVVMTIVLAVRVRMVVRRILGVAAITDGQ